MKVSQVVFLGVRDHVVALDTTTGAELWRQKVKTSGMVTVHFDGRNLLAGSGGEVWSLDPSTGETRWHNKLPRLGLGVVMFANSPSAALTPARHPAAAAS
ncbi:MAG TPA: PQQ-binding-like beta-propeller repeat protein [Thermoanaerobaculia bacterium]|nr:PQQ-binding-like beta-propeller repeat protein [Thermoanaerobaculia bacterium]